jgi:hypothetical protein
MADPLAVAGFIFALISFILIIVIYIIYFVDKGAIFSTGIPWNFVQGKSGDSATLSLQGNDMYIPIVGSSTAVLAKPHTTQKGNQFRINNQSNTTNFNLLAGSGVNINYGSASSSGAGMVPQGQTATFLWVDDGGNVQRLVLN